MAVRVAATLLAMLACAPVRAEYLLGSGDKIRVSVDEWPVVSGEFLVGADGSISLPVVGRVMAQGVTAPRLASEIGRAMAERTKTSEPVNAQVEVLKYRPFFVIGDVQNPGEYEYQPGLTVLKAVSKASGFYRPATAGFFRFERDSITARGQIDTLEQKAARLRARLARLQAQIDNRAEFKPPEALEGKMRDPALRRIVEQERALLASANEALDQQIASWKGAKALSEREIESLRLQIESETKQLEYVKKEAQKIRGLEERGLATGARTLDLERNIAQITGSRQSLETAILRSRQDIHRAEQKLLEIRHERAVLLKKELQATTDELNETVESLNTSAQLLAEAEVGAPQAILAEQQRKVRHSFSILRERGSETHEFQADDSTPITAGDVIRVERIPTARQIAEPATR